MLRADILVLEVFRRLEGRFQQFRGGVVEVRLRGDPAQLGQSINLLLRLRQQCRRVCPGTLQHRSHDTFVVFQ